MRKILAAITLAAALACGGSGGSGGDNPSATPVPQPYFISLVGNPNALSVRSGDPYQINASFGNSPTTYQWQTKLDKITWSNIGTNSPTYAVPTSAIFNSKMYYRVTATNTYGSAQSNEFGLYVFYDPPRITTWSVSSTDVSHGSPVTFVAEFSEPVDSLVWNISTDPKMNKYMDMPSGGSRTANGCIIDTGALYASNSYYVTVTATSVHGSVQSKPLAFFVR